MKRLLTKAEILWTRRCPLKCSYCAMIDYDFPKAPLEQMLEGVDRLADLGCGFFAIYGSSPLWGNEFDGLPEFIQKAESRGILTTVITDGIDKKTKEKLRVLYEHGLRSLTVSFDGGESPHASREAKWADRHTKLKSSRGLDLVRWFRDEFDDLRDVEVVATVTKLNWRNLLEWIPILSAEGIWFSFDFLHPDRGHPGTKCKGDGGDLLFRDTPEDKAEVAQFVAALAHLRHDGALVHQSKHFLEMVGYSPEVVTQFSWKCSAANNFPAWVTIDADGSVLPCDDFFTDRGLKVWDLDEQTLMELGIFYRAEVEEKCKGCAWSTHWDAVRIRDTGEGFDSYTHQVKP